MNTLFYEKLIQRLFNSEVISSLYTGRGSSSLERAGPGARGPCKKAFNKPSPGKVAKCEAELPHPRATLLNVLGKEHSDAGDLVQAGHDCTLGNFLNSHLRLLCLDVRGPILPGPTVGIRGGGLKCLSHREMARNAAVSIVHY